MKYQTFNEITFEHQLNNQYHHIVCGNADKSVCDALIIQNMIKKGKKVIYTVPTKTIAYIKYHTLRSKFPEISFGLITGDINTFCPSAMINQVDGSVVIMTQEVLTNYQISKKMDYGFTLEDIGSVIMDECHYITDQSRGNVWETSIIMLHPHIQITMYLTSLANAYKFSLWLNSISTHNIAKSMLMSTFDQYSYLTMHKQHQRYFLNLSHGNEKPYEIIKANNHNNVVKKIVCHRSSIINNLIKNLICHHSLPIICYTFSRKNVKSYAENLSNFLKNQDIHLKKNNNDVLINSIIPYYPEFNDIIHLEEYKTVTRLLQNGIGYHHSGMLPLIREMVEFVVLNGSVDVLFCTDSFPLVNKFSSTIFTEVCKWNVTEFETIPTHVYERLCGESKVIYHCSDIYQLPSKVEYVNLLSLKPMKIVSRLHITIEYILDFIRHGLSKDEILQFFMKGLCVRKRDEILLKIDEIVSYGILDGFIHDDSMILSLTKKGILSSKLTEISLPFIDIMDDFCKLTTIEMICTLSRFTEIHCKKKIDTLSYSSNVVIDVQKYDKYDKNKYQVPLSSLSIVHVIYQWMVIGDDAITSFIEILLPSFGIFVGDFVKCVRKIVAISKELLLILEDIDDLHFKLQKIECILMKNVCNNVSLYY